MYNKFVAWMTARKIKILNESIVLAYFDELSETYAPSTL